MTLGSHRYVVGYWESLWPSEPYVRHRFLVDIDLKAVIAGQDRAHRRWTATSVKDLEYMQQILDETYQDFFADPDAYGFDRVDAFPSWAAEAWPWPRVDHGPKRVDLWREPYAISIGPGSARTCRSAGGEACLSSGSNTND